MRDDARVRPQMRRLSSQIFAAQLAILTGTVLLGFVLFVHEDRAQLDGQYELRAAAIAQTVAGAPDIAACLQGVTGECTQPIETLAERIRVETGASYIVVITMDRVRLSHPNPALIGQRVEEPVVAADGHTHVGIDNGSTGRSANGKAPIFGSGDTVIGEVSAGIRESSVSAALWQNLPVYAGWFGLALAFGALASWLLSRRLKRRTFGLELDEIARLLQEREATLHGIREGVIAVDRAGRISTINDEALRLLTLDRSCTGRRLDDVVPPGRLRDVLTGELAGPDQVVLTDDYCLTVNSMPVSLAGRPHGSVVTLRDRTEMSGLLRELDSVQRLTDSLRAQQHEFSNRLHTLAGLLELGETEEALGYITELRGAGAAFAEAVRSRISSPLLVGLLLGKAAEASERGIDLVLDEDTWLGDAPEKIQALTTVVGNLLDNAFDALAGQADGRVQVAILEDDAAITVRVADNGPGIPASAAREVFVDGFTTKQDSRGTHRGLGLALVHRIVQRLNGSIDVSSGPGAVFTVVLPKTAGGTEARPVGSRAAT